MICDSRLAIGDLGSSIDNLQLTIFDWPFRIFDWKFTLDDDLQLTICDQRLTICDRFMIDNLQLMIYWPFTIDDVRFAIGVKVACGWQFFNSRLMICNWQFSIDHLQLTITNFRLQDFTETFGSLVMIFQRSTSFCYVTSFIHFWYTDPSQSRKTRNWQSGLAFILFHSKFLQLMAGATPPENGTKQTQQSRRVTSARYGQYWTS